MTDFRPASIYADDIETLESAGEVLFRHHENSDAIRLLAIALRLRGQTGFQKYAELTERGGAEHSLRPSPDEVSASSRRDTDEGLIGLASRSLDVPRSVSFACSADDIDESAGLADVVELSGYSRRIPCT